MAEKVCRLDPAVWSSPDPRIAQLTADLAAVRAERDEYKAALLRTDATVIKYRDEYDEDSQMLREISHDIDGTLMRFDPEFATPSDPRAKQDADLAAVRKLLWLRHGCSFTSLYGDDGEMQCRQCSIDFLRATPEEIGQAFEKMGRAALETPNDLAAARAKCEAYRAATKCALALTPGQEPPSCVDSVTGAVYGNDDDLVAYSRDRALWEIRKAIIAALSTLATPADPQDAKEAPNV